MIFPKIRPIVQQVRDKPTAMLPIGSTCVVSLSCTTSHHILVFLTGKKELKEGLLPKALLYRSHNLRGSFCMRSLLKHSSPVNVHTLYLCGDEISLFTSILGDVQRPFTRGPLSVVAVHAIVQSQWIGLLYTSISDTRSMSLNAHGFSVTR